MGVEKRLYGSLIFTFLRFFIWGPLAGRDIRKTVFCRDFNPTKGRGEG